MASREGLKKQDGQKLVVGIRSSSPDSNSHLEFSKVPSITEAHRDQAVAEYVCNEIKSY